MKLIQKYEKGYPCMLDNSIVGRIVGEHESGTWGEIDGRKYFSIPLFATPHGTIIQTGLFTLSDITNEGVERLEKYEKECKDKNIELYGGKLI